VNVSEQERPRGLEPEVGSGGLGVLPWRKLFKTVGFENREIPRGPAVA